MPSPLHLTPLFGLKLISISAPWRCLSNGGFGKLFLRRDVSPVNQQDVIRQNRDTLYGSGVFDLDGGPVTVALPDAGKRFISMQIINQNQYTDPPFTIRSPHPHAERIGTRYVCSQTEFWSTRTIRRTSQARALQDAIKVSSQKVPANSKCRNGIR